MNSINLPIAYACYNKNQSVRMKSTSGGIFSLIATEILRRGGVVYGAGFDDNFNVAHKRIISFDKLDELRGSKYPQSNIGDSFVLVKKDLLENKLVLFVGTPCHVKALKLFLQKEYANLWCIDFVCHGVASPGLWNDYLDDFEKRDEIEYIFFKSKIDSWKKWKFEIKYKNNKTKYVRGYMNPYMRSFLDCSNIRPSCYNCRFKGLKRDSDFTISDCWGIGELDVEMNDDKGLSALLIHNQRAKELFDVIKHDAVCKKYNAYELMKGNYTTFHSIIKSKKRKIFFETYKRLGAYKAFKKYYKPNILSWIKYYYLCLIGREK